MTVVEALNALKPLTTQFRAIAKLEEILLEAHRLEGVLPVLEAEIAEKRAEAVAVAAETATSIAADRTRQVKAQGKADDAIAALVAKMKVAEEAAAKSLADIESQTRAKAADLAERVKALEAKLAATVKATEEAEAKRAAVAAEMDAMLARLKG